MKTATFYYPQHGDGQLIKRTILVDSESANYVTGFEGDTWKKFSLSKIVNFQWAKPKFNQFQQARLNNLAEMQKQVNEGIHILSEELGFSSSYNELKDLVEKGNSTKF